MLFSSKAIANENVNIYIYVLAFTIIYEAMWFNIGIMCRNVTSITFLLQLSATASG